MGEERKAVSNPWKATANAAAKKTTNPFAAVAAASSRKITNATRKSTNASTRHNPHALRGSGPHGGAKFTELVVALQRQQKLKKAAGDPEAVRKVLEDEEDSKCMRCLESVGKIGLNHILLYVILIVYAFIGAAIFETTEEENELITRRDRVKALNESTANLSRLILDLDGEPNREARIREILRDYQMSEGLFPKENRYWDFWGALFFAGTIFTTIGYGHYYPVTVWGRVATMLYAVVGIPLVLAVLSDLGKLLTKFFKKVYAGLRRLWRYRDRQRWAAATEDTDSYVEWVSSDDLDIPIPVAILIFFGWILLCSLIFCIWETNWDFFTAFYFFFISLTTIGLGDVTPEHPRYMIFGCGFVIVGLSLISMVINIIQINMEKFKEATADYFEEELGWDTESSSGDEDVEKAESEKSFPTALGVFSNQVVTDTERTTPKTAAEKWKKRAGLAEMRQKHRRRRAAQTDASYLRDITNRYPGLTYLEIPETDLIKSRDDINSLLEALE